MGQTNGENIRARLLQATTIYEDWADNKIAICTMSNIENLPHGLKQWKLHLEHLKNMMSNIIVPKVAEAMSTSALGDMKLAAFFPTIGQNYHKHQIAGKGLMVVGIADTGWGSEGTCSELLSNREKLENFVDGSVDRALAMAVTGTTQPYGRSGNFRHTVEEVTGNFLGDACKSDCHGHIIYSNLYKIGEYKATAEPKGRLRSSQRQDSVKMLHDEISMFKPHKIFFLTHYRADPFLDRKWEGDPRRSKDNRHIIHTRVVNIEGHRARVVVSMHPARLGNLGKEINSEFDRLESLK